MKLLEWSEKLMSMDEKGSNNMQSLIKQITCVLTIFFCVANAAFAEGFLALSYHDASKRYAMLDEYQGIGMLYLTQQHSQQPAKDALSYMLYEPVDKPTWKQRMEAGQPPELHKAIASNTAVFTDTKKADFDFLWSADGSAVVLFYKKEPIAFITDKQKYGFSKAVISATPIVNPGISHCMMNYLASKLSVLMIYGYINEYATDKNKHRETQYRCRGLCTCIGKRSTS